MIGVTVLGPVVALLSQARIIPVSPGSAGFVRMFAESTEIRIAREAVSGRISRDADVYVYQGGHFAKAVSGSNGFACMVARSDQAASLFPMCFDSVGARTLMQREMMRVELYSAGVPYKRIRGKIDSALADGRLTRPDKPAMIYMMSPHQDLFSNTKELGRWEPHVMIYLPHTTAAQYQNLPSMMGIDPEDKEGVEIIVAMPAWSDQDSTIAPATTIATAADQFAQLGGVRVRYRIAGAGDPVVLIHGYANHLEGWEGLGDSLARGHEVIALDIRGHGQSTKFSHAADYGRLMADDVIHLLDQLHIRRAHIVGHSMGALIAANIVERYPKRVVTAALLSGPFWPDSAAAARALVPWETDLAAGRGLTSMMLWLFPGLDTATAQSINHDLMSWNDTSALRAVMPSLGALTVGLDHAPAMPVLIATGEVDPLAQYSHALASHWPGAHFLDIQNASHASILNKPEVLAAIRQLTGGQRN